jgi:quinol---cytochrome-c reductase cytochrome b subunit
MWPTYALKSTGLFFIVTGILAGLGGLAQINPIWLYGPYNPARAAAATAGSQPDWYVGWLDGALRVFPAWEIRAFDHTIANPFFAGALLPGLTFIALYLWPFIERRLTKDRDSHNLLDRPRDNPNRTGFGAAVLTFYLIMFFAGGNDILSTIFGMAPETVTNLFRVTCIAGPVAVFFITRSACRGLARSGAHPTEGPLGSRVRRTAKGGYEDIEEHEEHEQDEAEAQEKAAEPA